MFWILNQVWLIIWNENYPKVFLIQQHVSFMVPEDVILTLPNTI